MDGIIRETCTGPTAVSPHVLSHMHRYLSAAFFKALSTGTALQQPSEPKLGKMLKTLINTLVPLKAFSVVAIMSYPVTAQNLLHADKHW